MDPASLRTKTENCRFVKESQSLSLDDFVAYYGHRFPQCALIDEIGSGEEITDEEREPDPLGPGESSELSYYTEYNSADVSSQIKCSDVTQNNIQWLNLAGIQGQTPVGLHNFIHTECFQCLISLFLHTNLTMPI